MNHPKILTKNVIYDNQSTLKGYLSRGGYEGLKKALTKKPEEIIEEVKASGLRGRGGAGFPTGLKWSFVPKDSLKPTYLLINADESEPGTFKDRLILERDPHLCIEGAIIAAFSLNCNWAAIYTRGEYAYPASKLNEAIKEAYQNGFLGRDILNSGFSLDLIVHRGAGAYICGEETALIESLEGNKGQPRIKPPFPALVGLYGCPTVINNVETLSNLPWILNNGAKEYFKMGTEKSSGTKLFSVSGHVNNPGVYEVELGYSLLDFLNNECGGIWKKRELKALIPGGSSTPVLKRDDLEGLSLDYESLQSAGTMLGSGGMIVMDETVNISKALLNLQNFYSHESCGQCTPCREGVNWVRDIVSRIDSGKGNKSDLILLEDVCNQIAGHTICPFGDALVTPAKSFICKFREEFLNREIKING